ncbi:MAG: hypothetical protein MUC97_07275 [Bernardetiaceae bacterium]|jgi:hypothetical protein|nr:hypothetical protein [Bernardetiaceae bacterium]
MNNLQPDGDLGPQGFSTLIQEGVPQATSERDAMLGNRRMLTFASLTEFQNKVVELAKADHKTKLGYAESRGVTSLRKALDFENENYTQLVERNVEALQSAQRDQLASIIHEQNRANSARYRGLISFDPEEAFSPKAGPSAYSTLLNTLGLVKIGSDIYQFTRTQVKIIRGGDETKIDRLFDTQRTDTKAGIEVFNTLVNPDALANGRIENHIFTWSNRHTVEGSGARIIVYEELYNFSGFGAFYEYWGVNVPLRRTDTNFWVGVTAKESKMSGSYRFANQGGGTAWPQVTETDTRRHEYRICLGCNNVLLNPCTGSDCLSGQVCGEVRIDFKQPSGAYIPFRPETCSR